MPAASVRAGAGAVSFLTRVPVGRYVDVDGADVARGAALFPVIGAGVGTRPAVVARHAAHELRAFVSAGLAVAVAAAVTGAMHLDALADAADALGANGRDEALAIMRDSRIGTFGAVALALDLLLKIGCVATLVDRGHVVAGLVAAGALSRAASPPLAALLPYPRAEGGPGGVLTGRLSTAAAAGAAALGVAISSVLGWTSGLWLALTAAVVAVALGLCYRRWLGGATGDCLGTATELCETAVLVAAAALA